MCGIVTAIGVVTFFFFFFFFLVLTLSTTSEIGSNTTLHLQHTDNITLPRTSHSLLIQALQPLTTTTTSTNAHSRPFLHSLVISANALWKRLKTTLPDPRLRCQPSCGGDPTQTEPQNRPNDKGRTTPAHRTTTTLPPSNLRTKQPWASKPKPSPTEFAKSLFALPKPIALLWGSSYSGKKLRQWSP
jgi:hypothetical protein